MKKIKLTQGKYALVDDEDFEYLNQWKWCAQKIGSIYYAKRGYDWNKKKKCWNEILSMHRVILGLHKGDGVCTDHIDGNGLNNRRCNLRACTKQQNQMNQGSKVGTSKYKGVGVVPDSVSVKKWRARICINRNQKYLGYFDSEIEAAKAYDVAAKELFGEFANCNFKEN